MKICFLIASISGKGGTERVTTMVASALANKEYEVGIISCRGDIKPFFNIDSRVTISTLHAEKINSSLTRKINNYKKIWEIEDKEKYDVIIAVDIYLYLYLIPFQITKKCRCIAWEHFNFYEVSMKSTKLARYLAVKFADKIVLLGKEDLKNYKSHYQDISNITYIYNPVAFKLSTNANMQVHRIIAAGRLTKQKGFDLLIQVWGLLEKNEDVGDWRLDVFGEGEEEKILKKLVHENGLKRVCFRGYSCNLEEELEKSSIFVLTSRYEGFVLVLIEAMAKGLPCVSFDCKEGPREIIADGQNGFIVEEGHIKLFAEKLLSLMQNDKLRLEFSSKCKMNIERFNIANVVNEWDKLFKTL